MAREPELGIKVKVEPQVSKTELSKSIQDQVNQINKLPQIKVDVVTGSITDDLRKSIESVKMQFDSSVKDLISQYVDQLKNATESINKMSSGYIRKLSNAFKSLNDVQTSLYGKSNITSSAADSAKQMATQISEVSKEASSLRDVFTNLQESFNLLFSDGIRDSDNFNKSFSSSYKSVISQLKKLESSSTSLSKLKSNKSLMSSLGLNEDTIDKSIEAIDDFTSRVEEIVDFENELKSDQLKNFTTKDYDDFISRIRSSETAKDYFDIDDQFNLEDLRTSFGYYQDQVISETSDILDKQYNLYSNYSKKISKEMKSSDSVVPDDESSKLSKVYESSLDSLIKKQSDLTEAKDKTLQKEIAIGGKTSEITEMIKEQVRSLNSIKFDSSKSHATSQSNKEEVKASQVDVNSQIKAEDAVASFPGAIKRQQPEIKVTTIGKESVDSFSKYVDLMNKLSDIVSKFNTKNLGSISSEISKTTNSIKSIGESTDKATSGLETFLKKYSEEYRSAVDVVSRINIKLPTAQFEKAKKAVSDYYIEIAQAMVAQEQLNQWTDNLDSSLQNHGQVLKELANDARDYIKAVQLAQKQESKAQSGKSSTKLNDNQKSNKVGSNQITGAAKTLGRLETELQKLGNEDLSKEFSELKNNFNAFVESADHSLPAFTEIYTSIGNIQQKVSDLNATLKDSSKESSKESSVVESIESDEKVLNNYEAAVKRVISLEEKRRSVPSSEPAKAELYDTELIKAYSDAAAEESKIFQRNLTSQQSYIDTNNRYEKSIEAIIEKQNERIKSEQKAASATVSDETAIQRKINSLERYRASLAKANISDISSTNQINDAINLANGFMEAISGAQNKDTATLNFFSKQNISGIETYKDGVDYIERKVTEINRTVNDILNNRRANIVSTRASTLLENLRSTVSDYMSKNGNILNSDLGTDFIGLQVRLRADDAIFDVQSLQNEFATLRARAKDMGLEADTLTSKFTNLFNQHFSTMLTMSALHALENSLQLILQNVIDLDTAMTELRKVTNETSQGYEDFVNRASKTSMDLGISLTDYINSTSEWARLGYDMGDSEQLAKMSTLLANVGDGINSASDAAEYMISTLQGFQLDTSDAEHIVDVINEVANTQPIDAQGIAEILTRSAAAMNAAGNTMEETVALGTAMNAVLQNPDSVGTTLKTVSMYLRAAKTDAEEAGIATDGMASSISELRNEVKTITGVDIMADAGGTEFKSTYQILKEISEVWQDISDVDQANLTELLAGKRNGNALIALLQNFDTVESALASANNAAGSAMKENETYLNSIQGSINRFTSAFQSLSSTILDSGVVKGIVDIGTSFIQLTENIVDLVGVMPLLSGAFTSAFTVGKPKMTGFCVPTITLAVTLNELLLSKRVIC